MNNSPARNQFLLDCANTYMQPSLGFNNPKTPTDSAYELRKTGQVFLSYYGNSRDEFTAVNWQYNAFLQQFFRSVCTYGSVATCTVYNRAGEIVR